MRDYGYHNPDAGGTKPIVFGLAIVAIVVAIYRAPGPEDVRTHVETDASIQDSIVLERQRKFAEAYRSDSLERALEDCRLERAKMEVQE